MNFCDARRAKSIWEKWCTGISSKRLVTGTKWVLRSKVDEYEVIVRNKARQMVVGFNQEKDIDYEETFAPVAKLESIRGTLSFTKWMLRVSY